MHKATKWHIIVHYNYVPYTIAESQKKKSMYQLIFILPFIRTLSYIMAEYDILVLHARARV